MEIKEKRTDLYHVALANIVVVDGFNVRTDYGDIDALAENIKENGILRPLEAFKKDGVFHVVDGHRRIAAVKKLAEQGVEILIPIKPEAKGVSPEQRIVNMVISNDSKPLNHVEMADVVIRLQNHGWSDKEISNKLGWPQSQISFLRTLNGASAKVKEYVAGGFISAVEAVKLIRQNPDDAIAIIELALEEKLGTTDEGEVKKATEGKKQSVITKKDIDKVVGKHNTLKTFKGMLKDEMMPDKNVDKFNFLKDVVEGRISEEVLYEMFFGLEVDFDQSAADHEFADVED
jgi:ParB-like chromosome segregation protein Spo0J